MSDETELKILIAVDFGKDPFRIRAANDPLRYLAMG